MKPNLHQQLAMRGLSRRSTALYLDEIRRAERWCAERGHDLASVSGDVIGDYFAGRPHSHSTRKTTRSALTHYWAITRRRNPPLWAMRLPKKPRMVCRALDPDDARILAKAAAERGDGKGLAVLMGLYVGFRRAEIRNLRWSDFSRPGWVRVMGKGEKPAELEVHPALARAIARADRQHAQWVFPGRNGPVCPSTIWNWVREVADDAGVGPVPPHILRHTCLATANDATGDLRAVQEFARHSDPETTAGYTRASARRLRAVVEGIDYGI